MSKPLYIAESKEDHQWRLGGVLSMVTGKESPSPGGAGDGGVAQTQVRRRNISAVCLGFFVSEPDGLALFMTVTGCKTIAP